MKLDCGIRGALGWVRRANPWRVRRKGDGLLIGLMACELLALGLLAVRDRHGDWTHTALSCGLTPHLMWLHLLALAGLLLKRSWALVPLVVVSGLQAWWVTDHLMAALMVPPVMATGYRDEAWITAGLGLTVVLCCGLMVPFLSGSLRGLIRRRGPRVAVVGLGLAAVVGGAAAGSGAVRCASRLPTVILCGVSKPLLFHGQVLGRSPEGYWVLLPDARLTPGRFVRRFNPAVRMKPDSRGQFAVRLRLPSETFGHLERGWVVHEEHTLPVRFKVSAPGCQERTVTFRGDPTPRFIVLDCQLPLPYY